jgi:hypothetical protein
MSPLSALAGVGAGAVGLFTPGTGGTTPYDSLTKALKSMTSGEASSLLGYGTNTPVSGLYGGDPLNRVAVDANEFGVTDTEG